MFSLLVVIFSVSLGKVLSIEQDSLSRSCLKAHNQLRARHGAPPLKWSGELAEDAQSWANHLAAIDQMERDTSTTEGENIFYVYGGDPTDTCNRAVENWYSEVNNYNIKKTQDNLNIDHYSQVVGKSIKEIGVGTAKSKSGNFFLVARYNPKGRPDVLLILHRGDQHLKDRKTNERVSTLNDITSNLNDNASSDPLVTIGTTGSPDVTVQMATENSSESSANENLHSFSSSIFNKNEENTELGPQKDYNAAYIAEVNHPGTYKIKLQSHSRKESLELKKMQDYVQRIKEMNNKPPNFGKDFQVEIRFINVNFTDDMAYPNTYDFIKLRMAIVSAILQLYEDYDDFQEVQLKAFRNGSVIATLGFIFAKEGKGHMDRLTSAVALGRLGDFFLAHDYVTSSPIPNGYLRLTLPQQPRNGECPQPCSNPHGCFPTGCKVACCSFHPTSGLPVNHKNLEPTEPKECPNNCSSSCLPKCTDKCCWNKQARLQQDAPNSTKQTQQQDYQQLGFQPTEDSQEINETSQSYSCPANCPYQCYPQCTPVCCGAPTFSLNPDCSDDCSDICSAYCPEECCPVTKSNTQNTRRPASITGSNTLLPPVVNPKLAYMYGPKIRAAWNTVNGKGFQPGSKVQYKVFKTLQSYINKIASYKKPASAYLKDKQTQNLVFRTKGGHLKNALNFRQKAVYMQQELQRKALYKNTPAQRLQATKTFNNSRLKKASYSPQTNPGMQANKHLQSEGAPLNIRQAYRSGNRLVPPMDMPNNMDIKKLRGKKLTSLPAFKETTGKDLRR